MLLITSESNVDELEEKGFFELFYGDEIKIIKEPPTKKPNKTKKQIVAVGGGSVIDTAKMMSDEPIIAVPTTASGSAMTTRATVWGKKKQSITTPLPMMLPYYQKMDIKLPKKIARDTYWDCKAHIEDSARAKIQSIDSRLFVRQAEEMLWYYINLRNVKHLIDAGNWAGMAIEITGTGRVHALSYVLTTDYGIPHGQACYEVMKKRQNKKFDWKKIERKARKYVQYENTIES